VNPFLPFKGCINCIHYQTKYQLDSQCRLCHDHSNWGGKYDKVVKSKRNGLDGGLKISHEKDGLRWQGSLD